MTYAKQARAYALAELESRGLAFGCVQDAIDAGALTEREWQDLLDHYRGKPAGSGKPTQGKYLPPQGRLSTSGTARQSK